MATPWQPWLLSSSVLCSSWHQPWPSVRWSASPCSLLLQVNPLVHQWDFLLGLWGVPGALGSLLVTSWANRHPAMLTFHVPSCLRVALCCNWQPFLFKTIFLNLYLFIVCVYAGHSMCVKARGQLVGVNSLLLLCRSRDQTQIVSFNTPRPPRPPAISWGPNLLLFSLHP